MKPQTSILFIPVFVLTLLLGADFPFPQSAEAVKKNPAGIAPKKATDYIYSIIATNRTIYSTVIVERLKSAIGLAATENWEQDNTLLLPAQFLLIASKTATIRETGLAYKLKSLWPINPENGPKSDFEARGLKEILKNPDSPYTKIVSKNGQRYFKAIYPDKAVTKACVDCHNNHPKSPKTDYQLGGVMGGIIISIPLPRSISGDKDEETRIPAKVVAGYVHSVLRSDREVYSKFIVNRLQKKNVVFASENWWEESSLPLPAQFLLNASDLIRGDNSSISFKLISQWPANPNNKPSNEFERTGLNYITQNAPKPYLGPIQVKNGKEYFQAIYPDLAVTEACIQCHNSHPNSPKNDFKLGDIMGGIVLTFPVN